MHFSVPASGPPSLGRKDVELIAEADNGMQLLNLLKHIEPDVILLDIQMPIMDGIQTLPEIRKLYPRYQGDHPCPCTMTTP